MVEKAIWLDIARVCVHIFTSRKQWKYSTRVQKKKKNPAILPSYNYQNIEYDFSRQVLHMRSSKVIAACIFNKLQAVGLFLAFDGASTHAVPFTSGKSTVS